MKKLLSIIALTVIVSSCNLSQKLADAKPIIKGQKHQLVFGNPRLIEKAARKQETKAHSEFDNVKN